MNEERSENDLSLWFSTYGLITVERILERYKIHLRQDDLLNTLKTPNTFYHQLMRLPLKNVLNGIILQQAKDYQVYVQKLFIDYLLSGESGKSEMSPGALTRQTLETERLKLVSLGEQFHQLELKQEKLIAESRAMLIKHTDDWHKAMQRVANEINDDQRNLGFNLSNDQIIKGVSALLVQYDFKDTLLMSNEHYWSQVESKLKVQFKPELRQLFANKLIQLSNFNSESDSSTQHFSNQITEMCTDLKQFRTEFYNLIIYVTELVKQLPEYQIDNNQTEENRQELHFDPGLGDSEN